MFKRKIYCSTFSKNSFFVRKSSDHYLGLSVQSYLNFASSSANFVEDAHLKRFSLVSFITIATNYCISWMIHFAKWQAALNFFCFWKTYYWPYWDYACTSALALIFANQCFTKSNFLGVCEILLDRSLFFIFQEIKVTPSIVGLSIYHERRVSIKDSLFICL